MGNIKMRMSTGLGIDEGKAAEGRPNRIAAMAVTALLATLAACATPTPSEPVSEKLDPETATTITVLSKPIELLSQTNRVGVNDPFAYIAPFETNRMGARELFLWVSMPAGKGPPQQPRVLCNGEPLTLQALSDKLDLSQLNLSHEPYPAPVPWSTQWYFRLPRDSLKCLADAQGIVVETREPDGGSEQFTTVGRQKFASLDAFSHR